MRRPARLRRRRIICRRACAPLRHVAPLGRTAHSVALYSRQRNGTPAATVRRSWLSCQSQSECVPFANFAKNSEIFRNCAEIRKEKEKKHNFGKFIFCGNLPAAPSLRWHSVLVAVTPTLDLRPSLRRPYRQKMNTHRYSFSSFCFCGFALLACSPVRHTAAAGRVPAPLRRNARRPCSCGCRLYMCGSQFAASVWFLAAFGRRSKPVSGTHYGLCVCFSPCPSAFCQRTTKKFFCQITRL